MRQTIWILWPALLLSLSFSISNATKYEPNWKSLDSRPLPEWYDDAKIGIFIHFGVYSVPSFKSEWFWWYWKSENPVHQDVRDFMKENYPPGFTYQDFAKDLRLEFFNATEWIEIFQGAGAKYAVLTSKHHEGFTLWPSPYSYSWNSVDVGPGRDIVGEFSSAVKKSNSMHLGLYHSFFEWFNPLFHLDSKNNFTTRYFFKGTEELYELVSQYTPDLIWSDGDPAPPEYWKSQEFLAWLYNESPVKDTVVVNDRWGFDTSCKHGGFLNCADRFTPGAKFARKWENAMTLDTHSWGYRRNAKLQDYYSSKDLLRQLADTVSKGGNLLVDVGPTKEGTIPLIMQDRLQAMGKWLNVNGEAIYKTTTWRHFNDSTQHEAYYTASKANPGTLYCIFLQWPTDDLIVLSRPEPTLATKIYLLGFPDGPLEWNNKRESENSNDSENSNNSHEENGYLKIHLPSMGKMQHVQYAWTLKLTKIK